MSRLVTHGCELRPNTSFEARANSRSRHRALLLSLPRGRLLSPSQLKRWAATALSLPFFALAHVGVYQGWNGALRTGIVGTFFTLVVAICGSLWPAIVLHALIDLGAGGIAWLALREGHGTDDVAEVEPQMASGVESNPIQAELGK